MYPTKRQKEIRRRNKELQEISFGEFANFPVNVHKITKVICDHPKPKIQMALIRALHKLNGTQQLYPISVSGRSGIYNGTLGFEIGVANGINFHYVNDDMAKKLCEFVGNGGLYSVLDFIIIVTYHYNRRGKRIHLNFDHHHLRFVFYEEGFEMRLFHIKGIRRMPLDEFIKRIVSVIKSQIKQISKNL